MSNEHKRYIVSDETIAEVMELARQRDEEAAASRPLTPEQAWPHVKALWPDAESISRGPKHDAIYVYMNSVLIPIDNIKIDWQGLNYYTRVEK